jgi:hypothetical protein
MEQNDEKVVENHHNLGNRAKISATRTSLRHQREPIEEVIAVRRPCRAAQRNSPEDLRLICSRKSPLDAQHRPKLSPLPVCGSSQICPSPAAPVRRSGSKTNSSRTSPFPTIELTPAYPRPLSRSFRLHRAGSLPSSLGQPQKPEIQPRESSDSSNLPHSETT